MPGAKQAWPMVAACWSPAMPRDRRSRRRTGPARVSPNAAEVSFTSGSSARGTRSSLQQLVVPSPRVDVEQQRARGVGDVGGVDLAAGQPPQQEAVDGAEGEFAALGALARARDMIEQPGDLGAGEIGVEHQAGLRRDRRLVRRRPSAARRCRRCGGPARRWRCGSAWPVARSQTTVVSRWLVMPMAAMSCAATPAFCSASRQVATRRPDILRIVLDPAGGRESAAGIPAARRRRSRCRRETRSRATRSCPDRWREQTAMAFPGGEWRSLLSVEELQRRCQPL